MTDQTVLAINHQIREIDTRIADSKSLLQDPELSALAQSEIDTLIQQKTALELSLRSISGDFEPTSTETGEISMDHNNAIIEIRPGTGGEEAKLFAKDLLRMYLRFAEKNGYKMESLDENVVKIKGRDAYGTLKFESGVHRVQRVPVTEAQGRIHTSTASVAVLPEVTPRQIVIRDEDLEWKFSRAGGHGGQNVNKVSTAVTLTHKPSQIVVHCRQERYQQQNKIIALDLLRSQLWEIEEEKRLSAIESKRTQAVGRAMRSEKIRTYNYPSNRITDHRINKSWTALDTILEGDLLNVLESLHQATTTDESPTPLQKTTETI